MMSDYSFPAVPLTAGSGSNGGGMFGGEFGGIIALIVVAAMFGGFGRGGFGAGGSGDGGSLSAAAYAEAGHLDSRFSALASEMESRYGSLGQQISSTAMEEAIRDNARDICGINAAIGNASSQNLMGQKDLGMQLMQSMNANAMAQQECCCKTQAGIADVKYTVADSTNQLISAGNQNTNTIVTNLNTGIQSIKDLMTANQIQDLRDKVTEGNIFRSNCEQNAYLVNALRPYPQPAYMVQSPYTSANPCGAYCA